MHLSLSDLANIGNLVGGTAVLVSLIYLATQVRQAAQLHRSQTNQGRALRAMDYIRYITQGEMFSTVMQGSVGDRSLSVLEINRFILSQQFAFLTLEDMFLQHAEGMLDEAQFVAIQQQLRWQFSLPGFRAAWLLARGQFVPHFIAFMDKTMETTPVSAITPADRADAWRAVTQREAAKAVTPSAI